MHVLRSDATSVAVVLAIVGIDIDICFPDRVMANKLDTDDLSHFVRKPEAVLVCLLNDCDP